MASSLADILNIFLGYRKCKKYAIYKEKKPSKTIKCIMICLILLIKKQDLCDTGAYLI